MTHGAPGLRLDRPSRGRLSPAYIQTDSLGCNGCGRIIRRWAVGSISPGSLVVSYGFVYGAPPQAHYLRSPFEDPTGERCGISSYILTEGGGEFFPFCLSRFLTRSGRACDMGGGVDYVHGKSRNQHPVQPCHRARERTRLPSAAYLTLAAVLYGYIKGSRSLPTALLAWETKKKKKKKSCQRKKHGGVWEILRPSRSGEADK